MITFLELINLQYLTINYLNDGHFDGQIFHSHGRNEKHLAFTRCLIIFFPDFESSFSILIKRNFIILI